MQDILNKRDEAYEETGGEDFRSCLTLDPAKEQTYQLINRSESEFELPQNQMNGGGDQQK